MVAMLAYPITFEEDGHTVLVTSPDFPELTTFGEARDEAQSRALDALQEAIAARIHDRRVFPLRLRATMPESLYLPLPPLKLSSTRA